MSIEHNYNYWRSVPSDINEHLPTLFDIASQCKTVAEFGVRCVVSSYALAKARPEKLILVDTVKQVSYVDKFLAICKTENINAEFFEHDSRTFEMDNVDFIFIDTKHNYYQLKQELEHLGNKANKFLAFHDTITFGSTDEMPDENSREKQGLTLAIDEFLNINPHWKEKVTYTNNNGLTILERIKH